MTDEYYDVCSVRYILVTLPVVFNTIMIMYVYIIICVTQRLEFPKCVTHSHISCTCTCTLINCTINPIYIEGEV